MPLMADDGEVRIETAAAADVLILSISCDRVASKMVAMREMRAAMFHDAPINSLSHVEPCHAHGLCLSKARAHATTERTVSS